MYWTLPSACHCLFFTGHKPCITKACVCHQCQVSHGSSAIDLCLSIKCGAVSSNTSKILRYPCICSQIALSRWACLSEIGWWCLYWRYPSCYCTYKPVFDLLPSYINICPDTPVLHIDIWPDTHTHVHALTHTHNLITVWTHIYMHKNLLKDLQKSKRCRDGGWSYWLTKFTYKEWRYHWLA